MAVIYLEPGDLSAAQAAQVLAFLNRAASAGEIAARVEFPDELDIGVRLGQRLLDARAALGGQFTALAQVRAVPLIGPERFTELCAAILGLDPRRWAGELALFAERQQQLTVRAEQLQQQLSALAKHAEGVVLELGCAPQPAWLGQALDVVVRARDALGRPLANRSVSIEASSGELAASYGFAVQRGRAVTVRTGADGSARLALHYLSAERLTGDQQAALEQALAALDAGADSPNLLREGFLRLAAAYQDERGQSLRQALDIYARQWKASFFEQLNPSNLGFHWPLETCVLRGDHHPDAASAACTAHAVAVVQWKNWVGAWYEFLGEYLGAQAALPQAFAAAKGRGAEGYRLVDDLIGEAHGFVATQRGLAAQWVSQRVVRFAVDDFLAQQLDDVDPATQRELFSHLEVAAEQLSPASRGTIALVNQTRSDLSTKIEQTGTLNAELMAEMRGLHAEVLARASKVDEQVAAFDHAKADAGKRLDAFDRDYAKFTGELKTFGDNYASFRTDFSTFDANFERFSVDYTDFRGRYDSITLDLAAIQRDFASFEVQRDAFSRDLGRLKTDLGEVKLTITDLKTRVPTGGG